ncbi:MAG: Flp family type IVb pilin [Acidobacteria bacterium]|nr:Flp family type IVb pilin [Acidobacteriota bacterium]
MKLLLRRLGRLLREEDGQDLVEYGLLALFVAVAGVAAWNAIVTGLGTSYLGYDSGVQGLWIPNDPVSSGT